jgi:outer membrane protein
VPFHYEASDSPALAGMEDRDSSWEAGFALAGENRLGFAELTLFRDILGRSGGTKLRLELGKTIRSGRWTLVPSVLAIGLSSDYNDYYYGVKASEARPGRPAYAAGSGINLAVQTYLMFDLTPRWHLLGNLRVDRLSSEITDSPIVDSDWMWSGMVSLLYSFPISGDR